MASYYDDDDENFGSSVIGTKEYWEQSYEKEIENFKDHGDEGDVWFGNATLRRLVDWMVTNVNTSASILDIGCGNGITLVALAKRGFTNLHGSDYSESAVRLAEMIARQEGIAATYTVADVTDTQMHSQLQCDVCFDKGTYDAISLNPDDADEKRIKYTEVVAGLLKLDGILILTSCNWTEPELRHQFKSKFHVTESIAMPQFQFGSKTGQTVTSLVFRRDK